MVNETKKEELVKVETDKTMGPDKKSEKPDRKTIFLRNPRNIVVEDRDDDDYNSLVLKDGQPQLLMEINKKTNEEEHVVENVSVSVTPEFLTWLDVQKLKYGDLEMSRGDLLRRMVYDHPKLKTHCVDNGCKLDAQINCFSRSLKDTAGVVIMRSFKAHKKFNYEKYKAGIEKLIADCEED
jgi:hypothetical protein